MSETTFREILNNLAAELGITSITTNNLLKTNTIQGLGASNNDISSYFNKVLDSALTEPSLQIISEKINTFKNALLHHSHNDIHFFSDQFTLLIQSLNEKPPQLQKKVKTGLGSSSIRNIKIKIKPEKLILSTHDQNNLINYLSLATEIKKLKNTRPHLYTLLTSPDVRKHWLSLGSINDIQLLLAQYNTKQSIEPLKNMFHANQQTEALINAIAEAHYFSAENRGKLISIEAHDVYSTAIKTIYSHNNPNSKWLREHFFNPTNTFSVNTFTQSIQAAIIKPSSPDELATLMGVSVESILASDLLRSASPLHLRNSIAQIDSGTPELTYSALAKPFQTLNETDTKNLLNDMLINPAIVTAIKSGTLHLPTLLQHIANKNQTIQLQLTSIKSQLSDKIHFKQTLVQFEHTINQRTLNLLHIMKTVAHTWEKTIDKVGRVTSKNLQEFKKNIDFLLSSMKAVFDKIPVPIIGSVLANITDAISEKMKENTHKYQALDLKELHKEFLIQFETELKQQMNRDLCEVKTLLNEVLDDSIAATINDEYITTGKNSIFNIDIFLPKVKQFFTDKVEKPVNTFCQYKLSQYNIHDRYIDYFPINAAGDIITRLEERQTENALLEKNITQQVWNQWLSNPDMNTSNLTYTPELWIELGKNDLVFLPQSLRNQAEKNGITIPSEENQIHLQRNIGTVVDSSLHLNRDIKAKLKKEAERTLNANQTGLLSAWVLANNDNTDNTLKALQTLPDDLSVLRKNLIASIPNNSLAKTKSTTTNLVDLQLKNLKANLNHLENMVIIHQPTRFGKFLTRIKKFTHQNPWATPAISVAAAIGAFFGWKVVVACAVYAGVKALTIGGSTFIAAKALGATGGAIAGEEAVRKAVDYMDHKHDEKGLAPKPFFLPNTATTEAEVSEKKIHAQHMRRK